MREFVFALEYDPGTNPVADVLADHPDAAVRSLSCHVTSDSLWRVDHASGPPEALEALERAYETADYFARTVSSGTTVGPTARSRFWIARPTRSSSTPTGSAPKSVRRSPTSP